MSDPVAVDAGLMAEADALTARLFGKDWQFVRAGDLPGFRDAIYAALQAAEERAAERMRERAGAVNIIFDGSPSPEGGRFVEVETDDGKSINIGEWSQRPDGLWSLRIEGVQL